MDNGVNYKEVVDRYLEYEKNTHEKNKKKISVGLKLNIALPQIFLILSFFNHDARLVFLVLWIASLFGIAFYLLYVEYTDFKMQERLEKFAGVDTAEIGMGNLTGVPADKVEDKVVESLDVLDDKVEGKKQEIAESIQERKEGLQESLQEKREGLQESLQEKREGLQEKKEELQESLQEKKEGLQEKIQEKLKK